MIAYTPPKAADRLPVVSLAGLEGNAGRRAEIAAHIHRAARQDGFFYLVEHGVPASLRDGQLDAARRFFALPDAAKMAVRRELSDCMRGYEPLAAQALDAGSPPDLKESFATGRDLPAGHWLLREHVPFEGANLWPEGLEGFRDQVEGYTAAMMRLGRTLADLLALSLDLPDGYFAEGLDEPNVTVRLLRYPPHPPDAAANQLGSGAHTDWGLLTILLQDDRGGLEVLNGDGDWIRADPMPGAFVVNLGDMAKRMTGGLYHSNPHRVLNNRSGVDRYSVATFYNPHAAYSFQTAPTCLEPGETPPEPVSFGQHIQQMFELTRA